MVGLYDTLEIRIWRVSDGELLKDFSINPYNSRGQGGVLQSQRMRSGPGNFVVKDMAFSPDGKKLAFSTGFDMVYQYDRESNKVLTISEAVGTLPNAVLYSPDGNRLVNIGGTAQFYNTQNGRVIGWLSDHFAGIFDLEFQPGGNLIALACDDGHVWLRSNQDGSAVNALPKPRLSPEELGSDGSQRISDLDFSLDGQQIIFGSYDTSIWLWDLKHGARLVTYANDTVEQVAMSPDGKTIAYIYYDGYMDILNTSTGAIINWTYPFDVAFHPSGEFIIMANAGIIQTYFLGGSYADEFTKDSGHIRISPSGNLLAVGGSEHVNIYRIADKSLVWEFLHPLLTSPNSLDDVKALDFSPDERLLAVSTETEIYILDLTNGQLLATLEGESTSVSFSSDGKLLASGNYAGIVSIWAFPQVP